MNKLTLVAALAALTVAAGMGTASASDACAALQLQIDTIKATKSVDALKLQLAKIRLDDPTCPVIDALMAQIATLSTPTPEPVQVATLDVIVPY